MNSDGFVLTEFTDNESDNEDGKVCDNENENVCDNKDGKVCDNESDNVCDNEDGKVCDNESENVCDGKECMDENKERDNKYDKYGFYKEECHNEDLYVICKNNIPVTFCDNKSDASTHLLKLAWEEKGLKIINNSDYNYHIVIENHSLVYLYCNYKNWLLSYDKILCEFSYHKIKSLNK